MELAMKTWKQLADLAAADRLALHVTDGAVSVMTTDSMPQPLVSIHVADLTADDQDKVLRVVLASSLGILRELGAE
jgi:hypothetical protein